jgi:putative transposase
MPDHVHVLAEVPGGVSMQDFARQVKQISGFRLKQMTGASPWQVSYYDHILRKEEAIIDVSRYIWDNPVKEGLVTNWLDYPFSGPKELMWEELGET